MKYFCFKENYKTKKLVVLLLLLIFSLEINSTATRIKYSNKSLKVNKKFNQIRLKKKQPKKTQIKRINKLYSTILDLNLHLLHKQAKKRT